MIFLANNADHATCDMFPLANTAFTVRHKDTLLIPHGDYPQSNRDGKYVQKFTPEAAQKIANAFAAERKDDETFSLPIYVGHPDDPSQGDQYPDKKAYGWITNVVATPKGLALSCKWSDPGLTLLANKHYAWFSPFWGCYHLRSPNSIQLVEPVELFSIGLTNTPNIRAIDALANTKGNDMMNEWIRKLLGLANDATDDQVKTAGDAKIAELTAANAKVAELTTALANETKAKTDALALANTVTTERDTLAKAKTSADGEISTLKSSVTAERKARIELICNEAVTAGKITLAQKPQWAADLEKDLDGALVKLGNARALPTDSRTRDMGARRQESLSNGERAIALANERMTATGETYEVAWCAVKKAHPELFAGMKTGKTL